MNLYQSGIFFFVNKQNQGISSWGVTCYFGVKILIIPSFYCLI